MTAATLFQALSFRGAFKYQASLWIRVVEKFYASSLLYLYSIGTCSDTERAASYFFEPVYNFYVVPGTAGIMPGSPCSKHSQLPIFRRVSKVRSVVELRVSIIFCSYSKNYCRSQCPRSLRRWSAAARLLRLWVRIPPGAWISVVGDVCCQVEVSATSWSHFQRSPTDCGASLSVI